MKHSLLVASCLVSLSLNAGLSIDTLVDTPEGYKELNTLTVGDRVCTFNPNRASESNKIATIQEIIADEVVEITTNDGITITVATDQRLYIAYKWIMASQLTVSDVLFKKDRDFIGVSTIKHIKEKTKLRFITIDSNPTFWIAKNGVLVHNGAGGAVLGSTIGASGTAAALGLVHGGVGYVAVAVLGGPGALAFMSVYGLWTAIPTATAIKIGGLVGGIALGTATGPV